MGLNSGNDPGSPCPTFRSWVFGAPPRPEMELRTLSLHPPLLFYCPGALGKRWAPWIFTYALAIQSTSMHSAGD
ncbi:hypothetical protein GOP47_0022502 [Adiantum capillus-veneris]|uniref:Uncharacterized protein n=1 Tax=Adiantum capillus-veneris TaxID=13818 RepID=A0A9D4U5P4_ADICA|nr:hypothetical protein GOP47_0022502 [Adiantum capillus-veneris]